VYYEYLRQMLSLLRDFRNELVHRGTYRSTIEVFMDGLRQFVQQLLFFLISNKFKFGSLGKVAEFLDHPKDSKVIYHKLKVLNCVKKFVK